MTPGSQPQPADPSLIIEDRFEHPGRPHHSVGVVTIPGELELISGETISDVHVAYETWGALDATGSNAILVCHALTGDAHVAGRHEGDDRDTGWWAGMACPGGGIDTDRFFVVCANILGGCMGTTGPSSIDPETGEPYGSRFPEITVADIVDVHRMLLRQLGFERIYAVVGGSFGGMQALEMARRHPDFVDKAVVNHLQNAPVDAGIKGFPRPPEADFLNFKRPLFRGGQLEGGKAPAREQAYFQGPQHPCRIGYVDGVVGLGVEPAQIHPKRFHPFGGKARGQFAPKLLVRRRYSVQSIAYGVDVKT
jgi:pimeloyl-ACP methyl ester carboxylesterase